MTPWNKIHTGPLVYEILFVHFSEDKNFNNTHPIVLKVHLWDVDNAKVRYFCRVIVTNYCHIVLSRLLVKKALLGE